MKGAFSFKMPEYIGRAFDKYKYIILVCAVGVMLLMWPSEKRETQQSADVPLPDTAAMCAELEKALACIDGVGRVKVVLTLKSGFENIYAYDRQSSQNTKEQSAFSTDSSEELVIASSSGYGQKPVTVRVDMPQYQGVLVVCDGGGGAAIRLALTEAVSSLTGVKSDNITILKMKN